MDIYKPYNAQIVKRVEQTSNVITFHLRFTEPKVQEKYHFEPGQFNMIYLFGAGEVAISIVSDPKHDDLYHHTIRGIGRISNELIKLQEGDCVGIRGPFGRGWPLAEAQGKDVLIITGGLGCAPTVSIINYILKRREQFGRLTILQGVKHSDDLIYREQYAKWEKMPNVNVLLSASRSGPQWPFHTGLITELIDEIEIEPTKTICMMCGPEGMMAAAVRPLLKHGLSERQIYLSMERNMECAVGHCGHCQYGGKFVCKDGPTFCYSEIKELFGQVGF